MNVVIYKAEDGKLAGFGERGDRAWRKFRRTIDGLEVGETIEFSWRKPRSPKLHGLFFAFLGQLFDQQEAFTDSEHLRTWLTVGAGYADLVPGPGGQMVAMPKSIAWVNMDDVEFGELVRDVFAFLRTERAHCYLWPALDPHDAAETAHALLEGFER